MKKIVECIEFRRYPNFTFEYRTAFELTDIQKVEYRRFEYRFQMRISTMKPAAENKITVKPGYNALEGTGPREHCRRESVIREK